MHILQFIPFRLEKHKRDKFSFLRRYFTVFKYSGEPTTIGDETDEMLSMEDYNMFKTYLRLSTIEVCSFD